MIAYKPVPLSRKLGQAIAPSVSAVPPPSPDVLYTGYTGIPGIFEGLAVLAATGAAAWLGITTGMNKSESRTKRIAGWTGGIGAALAGLLYLGGKSGLNQTVSFPAVRVTPN